jgi:hypothetical protein
MNKKVGFEGVSKVRIGQCTTRHLQENKIQKGLVNSQSFSFYRGGTDLIQTLFKDHSSDNGVYIEF